MRQEDLARKLGVSKSSVANWESGKHFPKRKLGAVEAVLGINLDSEPEPDPEPVAERTREAFINAGWSPERADYFVAIIEGVRDGTIAVTRRGSPAPSGERESRRKSAG